MYTALLRGFLQLIRARAEHFLLKQAQRTDTAPLVSELSARKGQDLGELHGVIGNGVRRSGNFQRQYLI